MSALEKYEGKLAASREYQRSRYQNCPEWREKIKECNRQYYARKKAAAREVPARPRGRPRIKCVDGEGSQVRASDQVESSPSLKDN